LYLRNDPYENSDAVFGVKNSLVVDLKQVKDEAQAAKYGVEIGCSLIEYDFVLVDVASALELRQQKASEAMLEQGKKVTFIGGLPVPDVD
jgi:hypothetical protein